MLLALQEKKWDMGMGNEIKDEVVHKWKWDQTCFVDQQITR